MFPGSNENNEQSGAAPEEGQPASPQSSYPPQDSAYPPAAGGSTPPSSSNPYPSSPSPSPYGSQQPPANPYGTPLGGAPQSDPQSSSPYGQSPSPYGSNPANNPYGSQPTSSPYGQSPNPYGSQPTSSPYGQSQNPYPAPQSNQQWPPQPGYTGGSNYSPFSSYSVPVDANKILTYGILSFFCFGVIFGPIAFIQGTQAINAIDAGQADPSERGKVQAGRICGAIGAVLSLIAIIFRFAALGSMFHH